MEFKISINQLASFAVVSDAKKRQIIKQQKNPPKILVNRYGLAKSTMKKTLANRGDLRSVLDGIEELKSRIPITDWQKNDRKVSIEAMERFILMKLPELLQNNPYIILDKPKVKSFFINGVEILVSPDLVIRMNIAGQDYIGAVKLHVSKSDIFEKEQSRYVSTCLYKYLELLHENEDVITSRSVLVSGYIC